MPALKHAWLLIGSAILSIAAAQPAAVAQEVKPADDASQVKRATLRRHAAAGLGALNIYSTFGCLGLTAELYEAKKYNDAKVQQVTSDVIKTSDLAVEMLKNARREEGEAGADVPYEDLIRCYYLLDREARLLAQASKTGEPPDMQRFYQAREETWAKVSDVLGIESPAKDENNKEK